MHTVILKIQDNSYDHIMYLLNNLNNKDIEIVNSTAELDLNYETWSLDEINNTGKIGLHSKSFVEDSEDYST
ncbi:MAG: hypothetical protein PF693_01065 [Spirochaetia bacterium]|jgi:hypothetical protein|nr:hypothetical protein [Spirochaetia bacterium]